MFGIDIRGGGGWVQYAKTTKQHVDEPNTSRKEDLANYKKFKIYSNCVDFL